MESSNAGPRLRFETGCLAGIPCLPNDGNDKELSREPGIEWRVLDAPIVDDPCLEGRATLRRFGQGCPAVEKRIMPAVTGHGLTPWRQYSSATLRSRVSLIRVLIVTDMVSVRFLRCTGTVDPMQFRVMPLGSCHAGP